eukprot:12414673-Karenia_brevis.AAC.1
MEGWRLEKAQSADKRLAEGFTMSFVHAEGDWCHNAAHFHLNNYRHNNCCAKCGASKIEIDKLYTDYGESAGWRNTRVSHAQFIASFNGRALPRLMLLWGFMLQRITTDSQHTVDLGVNPIICANALVFFARRSNGPNITFKLHHLYVRYECWCKDNNVRSKIQRFNSERLHMNAAHITMSGSASDLRALARFCFSEARGFADPADESTMW